MTVSRRNLKTEKILEMKDKGEVETERAGETKIGERRMENMIEVEADPILSLGQTVIVPSSAPSTDLELTVNQIEAGLNHLIERTISQTKIYLDRGTGDKLTTKTGKVL